MRVERLRSGVSGLEREDTLTELFINLCFTLLSDQILISFTLLSDVDSFSHFLTLLDFLPSWSSLTCNLFSLVLEEKIN